MGTKVLIADDEPNIVVTLSFMMRREGYDVQVARDGPEALEMIRRERPDLVLLDAMMPGMTGFDVCEAVRAGIISVPPGQAEAARAIGLKFGQSLAQIILPQALRTSVPPVGSVIIAMFKNSAVVGAFGVGGDLYAVGKNLTSAQGYATLPVLTGVAIAYLCITLPAGAILAFIERKVAIAR